MAVARLLARTRTHATRSVIAQRVAGVAGVTRAVVAPRTLSTAAALTRPRAVAQSAVLRRSASSAAQEVEEAETEERTFPKPVLPKLTEGDVQRLMRQRNIGM